MSTHDREHWEAKYAEFAQPGRAHASVGWLPRARAGQLALDIACGRGRHSLALRDLGYHVVAVDIARQVLAAPTLAGQASIFPLQADLDAWPFAEKCFDLIVQCDFLNRELFADLRNSLRPGGLLLIDTFRRSEGEADRSGPRRPEFRLAPGELERTFGDWDILRHSERAAGPDQAARAAILVRRSG